MEPKTLIYKQAFVERCLDLLKEAQTASAGTGTVPTPKKKKPVQPAQKPAQPAQKPAQSGQKPAQPAQQFSPYESRTYSRYQQQGEGSGYLPQLSAEQQARYEAWKKQQQPAQSQQQAGQQKQQFDPWNVRHFKEYEEGQAGKGERIGLLPGLQMRYKEWKGQQVTPEMRQAHGQYMQERHKRIKGQIGELQKQRRAGAQRRSGYEGSWNPAQHLHGAYQAEKQNIEGQVRGLASGMMSEAERKAKGLMTEAEQRANRLIEKQKRDNPLLARLAEGDISGAAKSLWGKMPMWGKLLGGIGAGGLGLWGLSKLFGGGGGGQGYQHPGMMPRPQYQTPMQAQGYNPYGSQYGARGYYQGR